MGMSEYTRRIFHADDHEAVRGAIKSAAPHYFGQIVLQASTIDQALGYIPGTLQQMRIEIALIDSSFGIRERRTGAVIAQAIRDSGLAVGIISLSSDIQSWGDINASKDDGPAGIANAIQQLSR